MTLGTFTEAQHEDSYSARYPAAPLLTLDEERALLDVIKNGTPEEAEQAKTRFIQSNVKLVFNIASSLQDRGLEFLDLVQIGLTGVLHALSKYDGRGKFSTYATPWIRQFMIRGLADQGRAIRLPVWLHDQLRTFRKAERVFYRQHGRNSSVAEIAEMLNISLPKAQELRSIRERFDGTYISLDKPLKDDMEGNFHGHVATVGDDDPTADAVAERLDADTISPLAQAILDELPPMSRTIIKMRCGIGCKPQEIKDVAKELGMPTTTAYNAILQTRRAFAARGVTSRGQYDEKASNL